MPRLVSPFNGVETDGERVKWVMAQRKRSKLPRAFRLNCTAATKDNPTHRYRHHWCPSDPGFLSAKFNPEAAKPPKFELLLPSEHQVQLNERATFPVEYTGEQCDVKWSFNGAQLTRRSNRPRGEVLP